MVAPARRHQRQIPRQVCILIEYASKLAEFTTTDSHLPRSFNYAGGQNLDMDDTDNSIGPSYMLQIS